MLYLPLTPLASWMDSSDGGREGPAYASYNAMFNVRDVPTIYRRIIDRSRDRSRDRSQTGIPHFGSCPVPVLYQIIT